MSPRLAALASLVAGLCFAQTTNKERFFGTGKPPVFKEEDLDRRFLKSKIYRALSQGTPDKNCQQVIGGLLQAFASTAPMLHKRDENFYLEPGLINAVQTHLTTEAFPGLAYLQSMVRRVEIDGKMPPGWLATANKLMQARTIDDRRVPIDLPRLRAMADQIRPIDSFLYTLPQVQSLYELEVRRATSSQASTAEMQFRDTYLDREVAWGGLTLQDVSRESPTPPKKGKGAPPPKSDEPPAIVAHLVWSPPDPSRSRLTIFVKELSRPNTMVRARLAEPQYLDLSQRPRGSRLLVRGRLWDINKAGTEVDVRDAYLFDDPDTSQGVFLTDPQATALCPAAVNDLAGLAPEQPGGFGQH
jgi:hypothetical protein